MAAKLLSLYLLAIVAVLLVGVQAGTSASRHLVRANRQFADRIHEIAPLVLDQRDEVGTNIAGRAPGPGPVLDPSDFPAEGACTSAS